MIKVKILIILGIAMLFSSCEKEKIGIICDNVNFSINNKTVPSLICDYFGKVKMRDKDLYVSVMQGDLLSIKLIKGSSFSKEINWKVDDNLVSINTGFFSIQDKGFHNLSACIGKKCVTKVILVKEKDKTKVNKEFAKKKIRNNRDRNKKNVDVKESISENQNEILDAINKKIDCPQGQHLVIIDGVKQCVDKQPSRTIEDKKITNTEPVTSNVIVNTKTEEEKNETNSKLDITTSPEENKVEDTKAVLVENDPIIKKKPVKIEKKPNLRLLKRGRIMKSTSMEPCNESDNISKGAVYINIVVKKYLQLQSCNVKSKGVWKVNISLKSKDDSATIHGEQVTNQKSGCELDLSDFDIMLKPGIKYTLSLQPIDSNGQLIDISSCLDSGLSNSQITLSGRGAAFISNIRYKY